MENEQKRDYYLDFCRGIAALNIVFIHTVFWRGADYVPYIVQSLSLLLDVPFFFFLAGWGRSFSMSFLKTIKSLVEIYKKYIFFISMYFIFLAIYGGVEKTGGLYNYLLKLRT